MALDPNVVVVAPGELVTATHLNNIRSNLDRIDNGVTALVSRAALTANGPVIASSSAACTRIKLPTGHYLVQVYNGGQVVKAGGLAVSDLLWSMPVGYGPGAGESFTFPMYNLSTNVVTFVQVTSDRFVRFIGGAAPALNAFVGLHGTFEVPGT